MFCYPRAGILTPLAEAGSRFSFFSTACNITDVPIPVTFVGGSLTSGNETLPALRWNFSLDGSTFLHGNGQLLEVDVANDASTESTLEKPACVNRCCVFNSQLQETVSSVVGTFIGICQLPPGLVLVTDGTGYEPYDNIYHLKASPSAECPKGLPMTTFQPMIVITESELSGDKIIKYRYHAISITDVPDNPLHTFWVGGYRFDNATGYIVHNVYYYRYQKLKRMYLLDDIDISSEPDLDPHPHALTLPVAFTLLFGISIMILCQPSGSIFHRWHVPFFWRLVPGYAALEAVVIIFLVLLVGMRTRNFWGATVAIMVYRNPGYLDRRTAASPRNIADAVMRGPDFYQSQSIDIYTTLPVAFFLVKISVVEGATLFSTLGFVYGAPWIVLQAVILCLPKSRPDDTGTLERIFRAVEDIKHVGRLINSETRQHDTRPDAALNAQLMTPDILLDFVVYYCSYQVSSTFAFFQGKLLALQMASNYSDVVVSEMINGWIASFVCMAMLWSMASFSFLGLFIHFELLGARLGRLAQTYERAIRFCFLRFVDATHLSLWGAGMVYSLMSLEPGETYRPPWSEWLF